MDWCVGCPLWSRSRMAAALAVPLLALAACGSDTEDGNGVDSAVPTADRSVVDNAPAEAAGVDIGALPLSDRPLGQFPYFTLPSGYVLEEKGDPGTKDFACFPFWARGAVRWVEGEMYQAGFVAAEGKSFSILEVARNFDMAIAQLGGVKLSEEQVPSDVREQWPKEVKDGFYYPYFQSISNPTHVWAIRRADGNIWVMLAGGSKLGGYVVARERPLVQTSSLIPAAALRQAIAAEGKAAISVNFATDATAILPDSIPQINQVLQLMNEDPALRLSVEGHTDGTGTAAHNQQLSEGRATAVVGWLSSNGIASGRLAARGFGDTRPVASNDSEEGKARNRRVELVRQ